VSDIAGLRPSPDRVRETLFNWLQPVIVDSRCLDLFAGSGALGFEAASRGAAEVVMVDRDPRVVHTLKQQAAKLEANEKIVAVICAETLGWLEGPPSRFDIVFLDPPFGQGLIGPCCQQLQARGWLKPEALIYLETEPLLIPLPLPPSWRIERAKQAGQVRYYLVRS
jgi:16S rRNA (guanine966-N2)-methyltransferase